MLISEKEKLVPRYSIDQMREIVVNVEKGVQRKKFVVRDVDDHTPAVFMLLDAYCCMFYDATINQVLSWLSLDPAIYADDIYKTMATCTAQYSDELCFAFNGIIIQAKKYFYYGDDDDVSIFDKVVPSIRIEAKGQGLQYLREIGFCPDHKLRDKSYMLPKQRITRVDFAFDFIDYKATLYDDLRNYCESNLTEGGRISIGGRGGSCKCRIAVGAERIVYLGSKGSDKLVRTYDKKLEMTDARTGLLKPNIYGAPNSWIRIEWQTKDDYAMKYCLDSEGLLAVLKEFYHCYRFQDVENTTSNNRKDSEFWTELFDWDELPSLAKDVVCPTEETKPELDKISVWSARTKMQQILGLICLGYKSLESFDDYLIYIQCPELSQNEFKTHRLAQKFRNILPQIDSDFMSKVRQEGFYLGFYVQPDLDREFLRFSLRAFCEQYILECERKDGLKSKRKDYYERLESENDQLRTYIDKLVAENVELKKQLSAGV